MNWIILSFIIEIGFMPMGDAILYDSEYNQIYYLQNLQFYTDFNTRLLLFNHVFIDGQLRTSMYKSRNSPITFGPVKSSYLVGLGLSFGILELGFRHYCTHPIVPMLLINDGISIWEGVYQEIYIRIGGQIGNK